MFDRFNSGRKSPKRIPLTTSTMPNKAVEDDGDKRVFFGLRSLSRELLPRTSSGSITTFRAAPAPAPLPHSRFLHRASPLTFG